MKLAINVVQNLLLPLLEKDPQFDVNKFNLIFWETFTKGLLDFDKDAKPLYAAIYRLELNDPEKIISALENIYTSFIKELAEEYVLGNTSEVFENLLSAKNTLFEKEVHFFTNLEKAIKKVERSRIKTSLPTTYEKLTFELPENTIEAAIKKKEREALKEKMKVWDEELSTTEHVSSHSLSSGKKTKLIQLSWPKYAAAACVILGLGFWLFLNQQQTAFTENDFANNQNKSTPSLKKAVKPEMPTITLAEIASVSKNYQVIENGLGFAPNHKIKVVENNQSPRITSIVNAIEKYQKMLENEFSENKVGYGPIIKKMNATILSLQEELALLKKREKQYTFDGKKLVLYVSSSAKENTIVLYKETYYLKKDADYFKLTLDEQPQLYKKESNTEVLSALDKIIFDYGN
jgi:hypothetical protein